MILRGMTRLMLMLMLLMTMRMLTLLAGLAPLSESVQKGRGEEDVDNHDTEENDDVDVDVDDDNVAWHPYLRVSKRAGGRAHDYSDSRFIDTSLIRPKKRLLEPNKQDNI